MTSDKKIVEIRQLFDRCTKDLGELALRRREFSVANRVIKERDILRDVLQGVGKILLK
jgi:hypothetical protein